MGLEAHASLAQIQEAWPTVKGLVESQEDAEEWAGCKPDRNCKALRIAALRRALPQADADTHAAALCATLEADLKGSSSQARSTALEDIARLHRCAGSLASAWLTERPGPAELTAVEFCTSTRLRSREDPFTCHDEGNRGACLRQIDEFILRKPGAPTSSCAVR